ncbi:hypothetical protein EHW67_16060 [Arenibacter aquaticus]|uniref:Lipopolysaccharide biosynthesis protein n=1 Tax=Arenibacter aquaticus TaxID=2489054 RepID=A0A430JYC6_9FLAO|nr:oligosaccharide flippase family protein [Arenibacter aquaticus]RTE51725.1 hypothetical protein EHW67_16060 [Arenibacter aquaticus]
MEKLISYFRKLTMSTFAKNVSVLGSSTLIAQLVSIISAPLLYRIYSKEQYGLLGIYMAITGVVGVVSTLQYTHLILLERDNERVGTAVWLNRGLNIGFSFVSFGIVLLLRGIIAKYFEIPQLKFWLLFLPLSIFFSGQSEIYRKLANRENKFKILSINNLSVAILTPATSILIGVLTNSVAGLFVGLLVGQILPTIFLKISLPQECKFQLSNQNLKSIKKMASENKHFFLYSTPTELINRFASHLPVFVIGGIFGSGSVGIYNLCVRMLGLPIDLISSSITEVLKPKLSVTYNLDKSCREILIGVIKPLLIIGIIGLISIFYFLPALFAFVFGEEWREAGKFAQVLSFLYLARFVARPVVYMYFVARKQKEYLLIHLIYIFCLLVSYFIAKTGISIYEFLILYSIIYSIMYIVQIYRSLKFSKLDNSIYS